MKITILGCGALGQLWFSRLYQQGHDVQGWLRVPQPFCPVKVIEPDGTWCNHTLPANNFDHLAHSELLLVTLKAWQVSATVSPLLPKLNANCAILLLHNGMGTQDELPPSTQPMLAGTTTHAARHDGNSIVHVASGTTHIGPTSPAAQHLNHVAEVLHQALPNVVWHNNIASASLAQTGSQLRDQSVDSAIRLPQRRATALSATDCGYLSRSRQRDGTRRLSHR